MKELEKNYDPKAIEAKWYQFWEHGGYFKAADNPEKPTYCIVIPPPNVTGALHMGHALNNTLQDVLSRWKRMSGFEVLWQPGTDHAGIATQNVVEREILKTEGKKRQDIGRKALIDRIWKWKEEYGDRILLQLKALGSSCDWDRTRFTLDEGLSEAVRECFVRLYEDDLIYRGKYIVNWCPRCRTALADDEVEHEETAGHIWHLRYPLADDPKKFLVVATTRPETLLGDTAVAVNPKDVRYKHLVGKMLLLPETKRQIPIIADDYVESEFGSGAVKITPAHDPNDFQVGERHNLPRINVMNDDASMNEEAGENYKGLSREDCRKAIVEAFSQQGLLEKIEDHPHSVGHCYRCNTIIEPWLSDQWFVKMKPLTRAAIQASEEGRVSFHPARWESFYLQWLDNVRDWCISRQIWWGHRIPVWYCTDSDSQTDEQSDDSKKCPPIVSRDTPHVCPQCGSKNLVQDEDVLDTWFSSALWPFSTLGWPEQTETLKNYYPTSVLSTDRGIIYFWVARMVMMGLKFMGDVPFSDVYIHGTILDEQGRKMSKSLGNGIDPLEMIDQYGADAMRFSLIMLSTEGQDLKLSTSKFEMGRNFCNKLWNASRFTLMNVEDYDGKPVSEKNLSLSDKWILNKLQSTVNKVVEALEDFKFNQAATLLYHFTWNDFCDWYVESAKISFNGDDKEKRRASQYTLKMVLESTLKLLHPFLPFLTEEIWSVVSGKEKAIIISTYPTKADLPFEAETHLFEIAVKEPVETFRNIRGETNIPHHKRLPKATSIFSEKKWAHEEAKQYVQFFAKIDEYSSLDASHSMSSKENMATAIGEHGEYFIPLEGLIDTKAEQERLEKEIAKLKKEEDGITQKLANKQFIENAPKEIIEKQNARLQATQEKISMLVDSLKRLG
ncbi:MAG: valine--tRNA ligase [Deltaproteobacteria bacterium CG11_big_fil_rev_8_21_14_0_20_42_23]|nr:MAG: valine--tRNA ligase [Deltaproteobacteria bacterium CG11_big_fil_rev_8_21_14_0_20_42_23]PJC64060.1 MAG: valine--tRNA ligase [Deltaproteobacteria bacterium CG_4_9_14_0_2_um_filter_42_21]